MEFGTYIVKRVGLAKILGMVVGLIAFFLVPTVYPGQTMWLRVGLLLWYIAFGAIIGMFGLFTTHPMLRFRMNWCFRGLVFGAWLNLLLFFLKHDELVAVMQQTEVIPEGMRHPFLVVIGGAILGMVIDGVATRFAGEGLPGIEPAES